MFHLSSSSSLEFHSKSHTQSHTPPPVFLPSKRNSVHTWSGKLCSPEYHVHWNLCLYLQKSSSNAYTFVIDRSGLSFNSGCCWFATSEYVSKTCVQAHNPLTDWRTTHEAQGSSRRRWCFFFSFNDVTFTFQHFLASGRKLHYIHVHYIWKLTVLPFIIFFSLEPQGSRLQNCRDYIFSLHQTISLLSPTFLQRPFSLPVRLSLSSKNFLQQPAKLHCYVTLPSQLKWHNGYNLSH